MNLNEHIIHANETINQAFMKMNDLSGGVLLLFVVDENSKLVGSLTDGDLRRGLVKNVGLNDVVSKIMFKNFFFATKENLDEKIKSLDQNQIKLLPVVNEKSELIDIVNLITFKKTLPLEAFIMAGGEGKRLRPLTLNTPKPLLKVGEKPIIEYNIDRLKKIGVEKIHISIKYLGQQLKDYFKDGSAKELDISYVEENEPLGTIGSVSLVKSYEEETILLMNSDLLTNIDLKEMFDEFQSQNSDLMVATIPYKVSIPYAVMETENNKVTSFKEKPTYTYQSNAGIYLFKKGVVDLIPKNEYFNATDLMEKMIKLGKIVNYFPILGYWLDIGKHEDYQKAQEDIKHLKL